MSEDYRAGYVSDWLYYSFEPGLYTLRLGPLLFCLRNMLEHSAPFRVRRKGVYVGKWWIRIPWE